MYGRACSYYFPLPFCVLMPRTFDRCYCDLADVPNFPVEVPEKLAEMSEHYARYLALLRGLLLILEPGKDGLLDSIYTFDCEGKKTLLVNLPVDQSGFHDWLWCKAVYALLGEAVEKRMKFWSSEHFWEGKK